MTGKNSRIRSLMSGRGIQQKWSGANDNKLIHIGNYLVSAGPPYSPRDKAGGIIFFIDESQDNKDGRNS